MLINHLRDHMFPMLCRGVGGGSPVDVDDLGGPLWGVVLVVFRIGASVGVLLQLSTDSAQYALFYSKWLSTTMVPHNNVFIPEIWRPSSSISPLGT